MKLHTFAIIFFFNMSSLFSSDGSSSQSTPTIKDLIRDDFIAQMTSLLTMQQEVQTKYQNQVNALITASSLNDLKARNTAIADFTKQADNIEKQIMRLGHIPRTFSSIKFNSEFDTPESFANAFDIDDIKKAAVNLGYVKEIVEKISD